MKAALAALLALTGCDKILGLEDNALLADAAVGACDGPSPMCDMTTGNAICGRILATGADAATPLQVAAPTGDACDPSSMEGPCAYQVGGMPMSNFFGGAVNRSMGTIDDCGRYVVASLVETDVAILLDGPDNVATASIARSRMPMPGTFTRLDVVAAGDTAKAAWTAQVPTSNFTTGFLVRYMTGENPRAGEQVEINGSNPVSTTPSMVQAWVAYFAPDGGFGSVDPTATMSTAAGTAFVSPLGITAPFAIDGLRTGRLCTVDGLQTVTNTLILIEPTNC